MPEPPRSRLARALAESALVRLVTAYGETPEFVPVALFRTCSVSARGERSDALGPPMSMCRSTPSKFKAAPTTPAVLKTHCKTADSCRRDNVSGDDKAIGVPGSVVKIEFLADLPGGPARRQSSSSTAVNSSELSISEVPSLADHDWELRPLTAEIGGHFVGVQVRVATLPAYLLAKAHAAMGAALREGLV